jgi:hypothetical protein
MPNLKVLDLDEYSFVFLSMLKKHKIEDFSFTFRAYEGEDFYDKDIKDFLSTCPELKNLCFSNYAPKINASDCAFKLKSLEIRDSHLKDGFVDFLNVHKESLEGIILEVCDLSLDVHNFIYFELKLEKFLDANWRRKGLLEEKVNNSIKMLVLSNRMSKTRDFIIIEQILSKCQALETFSLRLSKARPRQTLRLISNFLPRVKTVALRLNADWKGRLKHLKMISAWVRVNGYHISFAYDYPTNIEEEDLRFESALILISSSKEDFNFVRHFGHAKKISSFVQISAKKISTFNEEFVVYKNFVKNLSLHRQEKRSKEHPQVRLFIENIFPGEKRDIDSCCKRDYFDVSCSEYMWDPDDETHLLELSLDGDINYD